MRYLLPYPLIPFLLPPLFVPKKLAVNILFVISVTMTTPFDGIDLLRPNHAYVNDAVDLLFGTIPQLGHQIPHNLVIYTDGAML